MGRARSGTVKTIVVDHGNPGMMHGAKASAAVPCTTDAEVLQGLLEAVDGGRNQFVFGRFTEVAEAAGCTYPVKCYTACSD
jgi:RNA exonuclease 1